MCVCAAPNVICVTVTLIFGHTHTAVGARSGRLAQFPRHAYICLPQPLLLRSISLPLHAPHLLISHRQPQLPTAHHRPLASSPSHLITAAKPLSSPRYRPPPPSPWPLLSSVSQPPPRSPPRRATTLLSRPPTCNRRRWSTRSAIRSRRSRRLTTSPSTPLPPQSLQLRLVPLRPHVLVIAITPPPLPRAKVRSAQSSRQTGTGARTSTTLLSPRPLPIGPTGL